MKLKFILIPILILFLLLIILTVIDFTIGNYIEISVITQTYVPLTCKMDIIDTHGARNEGERLDCFDEDVPIAKNGYCFFYNRHESFNDKYDREEKFSVPGSPSNFAVAIFDTDTNILSYYELDM